MENIYHTIRGRTTSPRTLESISKDPLSAAIYIHHKSYEPVVGCCGHIWLVKSYEIIWNHVNLHFRSFVIQLHADPLTARKPGRLLQQNILQGTSFPQTGARDITWPTQRWYLRVVVDSCWHGLWKPYTVFWKWNLFNEFLPSNLCCLLTAAVKF